ncbi:MAG: VWA domain-containing protein [Magnetococcus sp. YQC-3]
MSGLHLLRPEWLLGLLPLLLLLRRLGKPALDQSDWSRVCAPHLLPHLLHPLQAGGRRWAPWWVGVVGSLLLLAMAGPVWQRHPQPVFQKQSAMVLLLDLSRSMDAADLKPSRLVRAKHKMVDLLRKRREGQTAFLVFAGEAFVVTPLTQDTATITAQLASLDSALMPVQGSRADRAVAKAIELLQQGGIAHGHILLMTDEWGGEEQVASRVVKEGHILTILGIGTPEGAPIPLVDGGFLDDANGAIIMAKLDEKQLQRLAVQGGGRYQTIRNDDQDIDTLLATPTKESLPDGVEQTELLTENWREEGPWLVLAVLPLAALAFRRGVLLLLLSLLWMPGDLTAMEWGELWSRADQQAMRHWEAGNLAEAAKRFANREWKGAAHYRAGEYAEAINEWQQSQSTEAIYNRGTAMAKLGRLPEAAQAFQEVLQRQPDHQDARHNLQAVQKAMPPQEKPAEKPDKQGEKQSAEKGGEGEKKNAQNGTQPDAKQAEGATEKKEQKSPGKPSKEEAKKPDKFDDQQVIDDLQEKEGGKEKEGTHLPLEQDERSQERQVATEQWLRRVPDDPGGLLRRKFRYQYQQEMARERAEERRNGW